MATQETTAAAAKPARAAAKPLVAHNKTKKPSTLPVLLMSAAFALVVHVLFSLALQGLGDSIRWHPFAIDADVHFGEAQFFVQPPLAFIPFDVLFGFVAAVAVGFIIRLPFFRDRVYHTELDIKKRLMLLLSV